MGENRVKITTTISEEYHGLAKKYKINWNEALARGIREFIKIKTKQDEFLESGEEINDIEVLKEQIKKLQSANSVLQEELWGLKK
jgi:hypothetical protein